MADEQAINLHKCPTHQDQAFPNGTEPSLLSDINAFGFAIALQMQDIFSGNGERAAYDRDLEIPARRMSASSLIRTRLGSSVGR